MNKDRLFVASIALAVLFLVFGIVACNNPAGDKPEEPYAYITDLPGQPVVNIPIYFKEHVGNMQEVANTVIEGYRGISVEAKKSLQGRINQVWIGEVVAGDLGYRVVEKEAGVVAINAAGLNKENIIDIFEYIFLPQLQ